MTYQNEVDDIQFMQNDDHSYYLIFFKHATKEVFIYGLWQMDDGLKKSCVYKIVRRWYGRAQMNNEID